MFKSRGYWFSILLCLVLMGCTSNNSTVIVSEETSNNQTDQIIEVPSETFMMDLRETMNLSFKLIEAMGSGNYEFLELVSSSGVKIDKEKNQVVFTYGGDEVRWDFLKDIHLGNLEYWGSGYIEGDTKFQIILACFFDETHSTIYIDFIKEDNRWLFNGFVTNA